MKCSKCGCESSHCNENNQTCPDCDMKNIEWAHHWLREARSIITEKCVDCVLENVDKQCPRHCATDNFLNEMDRVQIGFN